MLTGKRALVTGGAQGMGRETVLEMVRQGAAAVTVLDVLDDGGTETVRMARELSGEALYLHCDLRSPEQISVAVSRAVGEYEGLDVLLNNAGVIERSFTNDLDVDVVPEHLWDLVMDVNVKAAWLLSRQCAQHLRTSQLSPALVNAASVAGRLAYSHVVRGLKGSPDPADPHDGGDAGARGQGQLLLPGHDRNGDERDRPVGGRGGPAGRADDPGEPRAAARHPQRGGEARLLPGLASEDAAFITGAAYDIDGGALAWRGHH